jgi:hypothetical protein
LTLSRTTPTGRAASRRCRDRIAPAARRWRGCRDRLERAGKVGGNHARPDQRYFSDGIGCPPLRAARLLALALKERVSGRDAYSDQLTQLASELVEAAMDIEAREDSGAE